MSSPVQPQSTTAAKSRQAQNGLEPYDACIGTVGRERRGLQEMTLGGLMKPSGPDVLRPQTLGAAGSLGVLTGGRSPSTAAHPILRVGSYGSQVRALQKRLSSLGYWLGGVDGAYGDLTRQAVVAIQKVAGLSRDGICGPVTWSRVDAGTRPLARSATGHVVEISKATQTLLVVDSGVVKWIYNTSTGSDHRYYEGGTWHTAVTSSGTFRVSRRVDGWDRSRLGSLYRPQYVNAEIAVHGYTSVPSTPASQGCIRVSLRAMDHLWGVGGMKVASPVLVY